MPGIMGKLHTKLNQTERELTGNKVSFLLGFHDAANLQYDFLY